MEKTKPFSASCFFEILTVQDCRDNSRQQNGRQSRTGRCSENEDPPDLTVVDFGKLSLRRADRV